MHLICRQKMKEGKLTNSGWQRSFFFFSSTQPAPPARLCAVALTFNWHGPVRLEERTAGQVKVSTIEHSILFFSKFFFHQVFICFGILLAFHRSRIPSTGLRMGERETRRGPDSPLLFLPSGKSGNPIHIDRIRDQMETK